MSRTDPAIGNLGKNNYELRAIDQGFVPRSLDKTKTVRGATVLPSLFIARSMCHPTCANMYATITLHSNTFDL